MRRLLCFGLLAQLLALPGEALVVETWTRRSLVFANLGRAEVSATATGLATLNTSSATSSHLSTLSLPLEPGLRITSPAPVAGTTGLSQATMVIPNLRSRPDLQGGSFGNLSGAIASSAGGLGPATLPSTGEYRICLLIPLLDPCDVQLPLSVGVTRAGAWIGSGVGGVFTMPFTGTAVNVSIIGAPYTVKTVTVVNRTGNGGFDLQLEHGFAHGPVSLTSSTARTSGVLQLVTATHLDFSGTIGDNDFTGNISRTLIHVVPEPGPVLLFGAGAAAAAGLGRRLRSRGRHRAHRRME